MREIALSSPRPANPSPKCTHAPCVVVLMAHCFPASVRGNGLQYTCYGWGEMDTEFGPEQHVKIFLAVMLKTHLFLSVSLCVCGGVWWWLVLINGFSNHKGKLSWKSWSMAHNINSCSRTGGKQMHRILPFIWIDLCLKCLLCYLVKIDMSACHLRSMFWDVFALFLKQR